MPVAYIDNFFNEKLEGVSEAQREKTFKRNGKSEEQMNQNQLSAFINQQIEVAVGIEQVRLAEKYISEKQMNFEMQYAIDLLHQALGSFSRITSKVESEEDNDNRKLLESASTWMNL
jgi:hypothetical protein